MNLAVGGQTCASLAWARPCRRWAEALPEWCSVVAVVRLAGLGFAHHAAEMAVQGISE